MRSLVDMVINGWPNFLSKYLEDIPLLLVKAM